LKECLEVAARDAVFAGGGAGAKVFRQRFWRGGLWWWGKKRSGNAAGDLLLVAKPGCDTTSVKITSGPWENTQGTTSMAAKVRTVDLLVQ
jgi:hypothetical protein